MEHAGDKFADNWVTAGWSKIEGVWIELGQSAGVTIEPSPLPPELTIHDIAAKLNELESLRKEVIC